MTTPNEEFEFGDPAGLGDIFKAADNIGSLVAFVESQRVEENTRFGAQEATRCRYVVVLDGAEEGTVFDNAVIWGNLSRDAYSNGEQQIVLGRIVQGDAKPGQNPPFFLEPATDAEKDIAGTWFKAHAVRNQAGRILIG